MGSPTAKAASSPPVSSGSLLSSWRTGILLALLLVFVLPLSGALPAAAKASGPKGQPELLDQAAGQPDQTFRVIVQRQGGSHNADAAARARDAKKIKDVTDQGFVAEVKGKDLADLAKDPSVKYVSIDAPIVMRGGGSNSGSGSASAVNGASLGTIYPREMSGPPMWTSKWTGFGVGVAVVDSGIDPLPDFNDVNGKSRLVVNTEFSAASSTTLDNYGHGTHVAGLIGGNSWLSSDKSVQGKYIGMAPQASLINAKVAGDDGTAYVSDIVNAINWVVDNRATYNIRVLNLSLTSTVPESYTTSMLDAAVENAWFHGIFVVVAAGNDGPDTMQYPPANDPFVMTVGAADPVNTTSLGDDGMAPWSSYGTTQDGVSKPEIVAPGRYLTAPLAGTNTVIGQALPDRITNNDEYIWLSGTSMSAAIVSGIAADIFQHYPSWTNDQLKSVMTSTAQTLGGSNPLPGQGSGEVNPGKFWNYKGTPQYANQGLTISSQLLGPNGATVYSADLTSSSWRSSSWSSTSWSSSSWSSSSWRSTSWRSTSWRSCLDIE